MDGIGGTVKNVVFRHVKSGQVIINSAEDFCHAANQSCPSITTLFQPSDSILSEPSDIESAPVIPSTLKIHKLVRETNSKNGGSKINFFFLSNDDEPCHSKTYSKKIGCGHIDRDFDSLAEFRSTCAYCLERHMEDDETEDWLRCPMCMQWFHEGCFEQ